MKTYVWGIFWGAALLGAATYTVTAFDISTPEREQAKLEQAKQLRVTHHRRNTASKRKSRSRRQRAWGHSGKKPSAYATVKARGKKKPSPSKTSNVTKSFRVGSTEVESAKQRRSAWGSLSGRRERKFSLEPLGSSTTIASSSTSAARRARDLQSEESVSVFPVPYLPESSDKEIPALAPVTETRAHYVPLFPSPFATDNGVKPRPPVVASSQDGGSRNTPPVTSSSVSVQRGESNPTAEPLLPPVSSSSSSTSSTPSGPSAPTPSSPLSPPDPGSAKDGGLVPSAPAKGTALDGGALPKAPSVPVAPVITPAQVAVVIPAAPEVLPPPIVVAPSPVPVLTSEPAPTPSPASPVANTPAPEPTPPVAKTPAPPIVAGIISPPPPPVVSPSPSGPGPTSPAETTPPPPPPCGSAGSLEPLRTSLLLLEPTREGSLNLNGNAHLVVGAEARVNSNHAAAIVMVGNAQLTALDLAVSGLPGIRLTSRARLNIEPRAGLAPSADPLRYLPAPDPRELLVRSSSLLHLSKGSHNLEPGIYEGGIAVSGTAALTLDSGIYYIRNGGFSVIGRSSLSANGALIYQLPGTSSNRVSLTGDGRVDLSGPTQGLYQGIALFAERSSAVPLEIGGRGELRIQGAIYAAGAEARLQGNGVVAAGSHYIARTMSVGGNGEIQISGDSAIAPLGCAIPR